MGNIINNTCNFKTKTLRILRQNPGLDDYWVIAPDIGYSGVKVFAPNSISCFPSYARKVEDNEILLGIANSKHIQYRDETGTWMVGEEAQNMITSDESKDSSQALYGKNRYFSHMFKVIARTGIAMGLFKNNYGDPTGKTIIIQTGLPPKYMKEDEKWLKEVLKGSHEFEIKLANDNWIKFNFEIMYDNIFVMPQPMGSFFSAITDSKGKSIPDARKFQTSNILIADGGFKTFDTFDINSGRLKSYDTFDDLGMKQVFQQTSNEILKTFGVDIPVYAMQKYLAEGKVTTFDRASRKTELKDFTEILNNECKAVCIDAMERICNMYNDLIDYKYLLMTGGTGFAWLPITKDYFSGMSNLTITTGMPKDESLSSILSNARGYYFSRVMKLKQMMGK